MYVRGIQSINNMPQKKKKNFCFFYRDVVAVLVLQAEVVHLQEVELLAHLVAEARSRGYQRLSLETGSMAEFMPARTLYESFGFEYCGPFGDYELDPNSVFMRLGL